MKSPALPVILVIVGLCHPTPVVAQYGPEPETRSDRLHGPYVERAAGEYTIDYQPPHPWLIDENRIRRYKNSPPPYDLVLNFPPEPPVLGTFWQDQRHRPLIWGPAQRAKHIESVQEPFYVPLDLLSSHGDLTRARRQSLDRYRELRARLLTDLRKRLDSLRDAAPGIREREIAAFAREQAPQLARLEKTADDLRAEFARVVIAGRKNGFWRSAPPLISPAVYGPACFPGPWALRTEAVFQDGYSIPQRSLLREMALDAETDPRLSNRDAQNVVTLSPETARIPLPTGLPADLAAKIAAYQTEKHALKEELRSVIRAHYDSAFDFTRVRALQALAEKQAGRFARLDEFAGEIRRGLAAQPGPELPVPLRERIAGYQRRMMESQGRLLDKLEEMAGALPDDDLRFFRVGENYQVALRPPQDSTAVDDQKRQAVLASLASFNEDQHLSSTALAAEKAALASELAHRAVPPSAGSPAKDVDQLLGEFSLAELKNDERYRECRLAVLEPGLSPAQRRLLFGSAFETMVLLAAN